jgi:hypothetical protein
MGGTLNSDCLPRARRPPKSSGTNPTLLQTHGWQELSAPTTDLTNAEPYGKALAKYNLYLGASANGDRLNALYRENIDEQAILSALRILFAL